MILLRTQSQDTTIVYQRDQADDVGSFHAKPDEA